MHQKLPRQLVYMSKFIFYGLTFQLFFSSLLIASDGLAQKPVSIEEIYIDLNFENVSLESVFQEITDKTKLKFAFENSQVNVKQNVSVQALNTSLADVLREISQNYQLKFLRINNNIFVSRKDGSQGVEENLGAMENMLQVSGTVTSMTGQSTIPGVNILVKGSNLGTVSDINGSYSVNVPNPDDTLIFSSIGYLSEEVPVNGRTTVDVSLAEDIQSLKEIVVVGYGTQKKSDLTGAVSSVSSEKIKDLPISRIEEGLAGQVSGVQIQQGTGAPGAAPSVRIRGTGSITAGNGPLYVIDGFAGAGDLSSINPNDIESIEILKDASAAAIYGSRGGNGVVLITTKSGSSKEQTINARVYGGFQEVTTKFDVLNAREWADFLVEARNNAWVDAGGSADDPNEVRDPSFQIPPQFSDPSSFGEGTDWQDEIFQLAPIQSYDLSLSGGNEKTQYFISGSYFDQEGIIKNSGFNRYTLRAKVDVNITNKIKLGVNVAPSYSKENHVNAEGHWGSNGAILSALNLPPVFSPYEEEGSYGSLVNFGWGFPSIPSPLIPINEMSDTRTTTKLLGISYLDFEILKGLNFKTSVNASLVNNASKTYRTSQAERDGRPAPQPPEATYNTYKDINWLWENTLAYSKFFNDKHYVNALLGYTIQKTNYEDSYVFATNFANDQVRTLNAGQVTDGSSFAYEWSLISYLARVNYTYDDKYLFTATVRRDGSSRFGEDARWGVFPSASVGWRISDENFMEEVDFVSNLKLRASYGLTGNNSIPNYGAIGLLGVDNYVFGVDNSNIVNGIVPNTISNNSLSWEKTKQLNIGLELGLFQDRIFFEAERYISNTTDLLLEVPVPSLTGYTNALQNIGEVENKGWEFSLTSRNLVRKFKWTTNFNISANKNKVLALGPEGDPIRAGSKDSHITQIGSPLGSYYGYIFEGIYDTQEEIDARPHLDTDAPGDPIIKNVNEDGIISPDDRTLLGDNFPDFIYGLTNTFSYKNFDLNVLIQGVQGNEIQLRDYTWLYLTEGKMNVAAAINDRWRSPENPGNGEIPRADARTQGYRRQPSTLWVQDGSFLRVRNITFGYSLPTENMAQKFIKSARIYFSVQNALTFTDFTGYNPEVSRTETPLTPGMQEGGYPVPRTYSLGVNISL